MKRAYTFSLLSSIPDGKYRDISNRIIREAFQYDDYRYQKEAGIRIMDDGWDINYPNNYDGDDPVDCNERIGKAALRIEAERLANAVKLYKEDTLLWEVHQKRQRGRK